MSSCNLLLMGRSYWPMDAVLFRHPDKILGAGRSGCSGEELVRNSGLPASALIEVGTEHQLAEKEPLEAMLRACEGGSTMSQPEVIEIELKPARFRVDQAFFVDAVLASIRLAGLK
jgi:hypothetical protein